MKGLKVGEARRALELVDGLLCRLVPGGGLAWLSSGWQALRGEGRALPDTFAGLHIDEDADAARAMLDQLWRTGAVSGVLLRMVDAAGGLRWLRWSARTDGTAAYGTAVDVTEERARALRYREARDMLGLAVDIAQLGQWRLGLADGVLWWSPQTFRIHGLPDDSPQPDVDAAIGFYHPDDRGRVTAAVDAALATGAPYSFELRLLRADGEERQVRSRGIAVRDASQRISAIVGTFQDVTDERRVERELRDTERLASMSTLANGIAHEINNPLQYLQANLELLEGVVDQLAAGAAPAKVTAARRMLDDCMKGADQVRTIVSELRAFMQGPRDDKNAELIDVRGPIRTALSMTRAQLRAVARVVESHAPVPRVMAINSELIQVVVNLLGNAAHSLGSAGGGTIRVASHAAPDGRVIVEVEDDGPGVPPALRTRIFEPYFTTKPLGIGHGLGLHVCRGIVESHSGTLSLHAEPGRTIFRISLPPGEAAPPAQAAPGGRPRVLVVDDDELVSRSIAMMLDKGCATVVLHDPAEALRHLQREHFDAVVSDVMMPGMTGWELAMRADAAVPGTSARFLLVSGAAPDEYRPPGAPALAFLEKPFRLRELRARVGEILEAGGHTPAWR